MAPAPSFGMPPAAEPVGWESRLRPEKVGRAFRVEEGGRGQERRVAPDPAPTWDGSTIHNPGTNMFAISGRKSDSRSQPLARDRPFPPGGRRPERCPRGDPRSGGFCAGAVVPAHRRPDPLRSAFPGNSRSSGPVELPVEGFMSARPVPHPWHGRRRGPRGRGGHRPAASVERGRRPGRDPGPYFRPRFRWWSSKSPAGRRTTGSATSRAAGTSGSSSASAVRRGRHPPVSSRSSN